MSDRPPRAELLKLTLDEYIKRYVPRDRTNYRRNNFSQSQERRHYARAHYFAPAYQSQHQRRQRQELHQQQQQQRLEQTMEELRYEQQRLQELRHEKQRLQLQILEERRHLNHHQAALKQRKEQHQQRTDQKNPKKFETDLKLAGNKSTKSSTKQPTKNGNIPPKGDLRKIQFVIKQKVTSGEKKLGMTTPTQNGPELPGCSNKKKQNYDFVIADCDVSTEKVIAEIEEQLKEDSQMEDDINSDMLYIPTNSSLND